MITKAEIEQLGSSGGLFVSCFLCKKPVKSKLFYEIRKCGHSGGWYDCFKNSSPPLVKSIIFHDRCWEEFAGEELCFEK